MSYISSNNNRWYCQLENSYGQVASISASNRFPAVKLSVQQKVEAPTRKDKTGTRTFPGALSNLRKNTQFDLTTYMTAWSNPGSSPGYGPLFQAALGGAPQRFNGGTAAGGSSAATVVFGSAHGLSVGQAIAFAGELRFVVAVADTVTVVVNAPFSTSPTAGSPIGQTMTYRLSTELPSISIFDYWTPASSVQRLLCGCAVDGMDIKINGDYQEFDFNGIAQDVLDSNSFAIGSGQLSSFPPEPTAGGTPVTVIPGHLGQVWLGLPASRFFTLTGAKVSLRNNLDARTREFGSLLPRAINPGTRTIKLDLDLYGQDDAATTQLYQFARQRQAVSAAFQVGQTGGQLFGMYLKGVVPEVPEYNDKESRLQWQFRASQAQGQSDDELFVAFG